jgi:hypothetical protein
LHNRVGAASSFLNTVRGLLLLPSGDWTRDVVYL